MLERGLLQLKAYNKTCDTAGSNDPLYKLKISEAEEAFIIKVRDILKPFKKNTVLISGEK